MPAEMEHLSTDPTILTLTVNPSVHQTMVVHHLIVGKVNCYHGDRLDPAGKGINVSRMVQRLGWPTVAFGFLGGEIGRLIRRLLDAEGVPAYFVPIEGQSRRSITVVDQTTNAATSFYGLGPVIAEQPRAEIERMLQS